MASLGYTVPAPPDARVRLRGLHRFAGGDALRLVERPDRTADLGLGPTIELLVIAVIGGLGRIEGAWIGAFAFIIINNYVVTGYRRRLPVVGGRFNTIIGLIFLAHHVVSPDGLTGLGPSSASRRGGHDQSRGGDSASRRWERARRRGGIESAT